MGRRHGETSGRSLCESTERHVRDTKSSPVPPVFTMTKKKQREELESSIRIHLSDEGALTWTEGTRENYLERSHELLKHLSSFENFL